MKRLSKSCFSLALLLLLTTVQSQAHTDAQDLIDEVNTRIAQSPDVASLYVKRAQLFRETGQYDRAHADFKHAIQLMPKAEDALIGLAELELDREQFAAAIAVVDAYLKNANDAARGSAFLIRARALARGERRTECAEAYHLALTKLNRPRVQHFLEAARCVAREEGPESALSILAHARAERGQVISLELLAIELEVKAGQHDAALVRIDRQLDRARRPERWLFRRAEVLVARGAIEEARATYQLALTRIDALPLRLRSTRAGKELEKAIRDGLTEASLQLQSSVNRADFEEGD